MPRWFMPDVASWIWSPLMIDGASRYAVLWSVEQVTSGRFGSSLPARMSSLSHNGGLVLQGKELNALPGALPPLLLCGDALGEILARIGGRRLVAVGGSPGGGARSRAPAGCAGAGLGAGLGGWASGSCG